MRRSSALQQGLNSLLRSVENPTSSACSLPPFYSLRHNSSAGASSSSATPPASKSFGESRWVGPTASVKQHVPRYHRWLGFGAAGVTGGLVLAGILSHPSMYDDNAIDSSAPDAEENFSLLGLQRRQRIFFKYEKRVRASPKLQKLFSYFATQEREPGLKSMLPHDLLRAVVPTYPPHGTKQERAGFLDGERTPQALQNATAAEQSIFTLFDVDGDGVVSFFEFLLVLTLLSIPESNMQAIFDTLDMEGKGSIDAETFQTVLPLLRGRASKQGATQEKELAFMPSEGAAGLLLTFFGPDQLGTVSPEAFRTFVLSMHEALVELEFAHYDVTASGAVLGIDFAHSLVTSASLNVVDALLDKADALPEALFNARVSFQEFKDLHLLHRRLPPLQVAMDFMLQLERPITQTEFGRLVQRLAGVQLTPQTLSIIFHVFGRGDGSLDGEAFMDVMHRRRVLHDRKSNESQGGLLQAFWGRGE